MKTIPIKIIALSIVGALAFTATIAFAATINTTKSNTFKVNLPDAGLTPDSPFYFLDRLGEALQEFFTFNPEAKAHLQITFAAERIAEIKVMLETKGVEARGLDIAESRLKAHLASAVAIVGNQKARGKDVSQLTKELGDEFEAPKIALEQTFKNEKRALKAKEKELKAEIRTARQAGDTAQVEALLRELDDIKTQKELLEQKENKQGEDLDEQEEALEEQMKASDKAAKQIRKAEKEKAEITREAQEEGIDIPAEIFARFDSFLAQAKAAFDSGKYEEAKRLAEQAKESLDAAEESVDSLKESKDKEEEAEADRKEHEQEVKNDQEEKVREKNKKEQENLKEKQNKAEEETKKAEEKLRTDSGINNEQKTGNEEGASQSAAAPSPKNWAIKVEDGRFNPSEIKIKKGDTVTWINNGSEPVWPASAFHPTHTVYPGFDALKGLGNGESYSFKFDRVGSWKYHNHLNPSVTGVVVVEE